MNIVAKPLKSLRLQGGRWIRRLSAWVHARCLPRRAQRSRVGLLSGCSRWLMNHPGLGLHQAHHRQRDRGRGTHPLGQHGSDLRGGLADGGMSVNLRMLRRINQGEEVEAAAGIDAGIGLMTSFTFRSQIASQLLRLSFLIHQARRRPRPQVRVVRQ